MAKYKALSLFELFRVLEVFIEKTCEIEKLNENMERQYKEVCEYVKETGKAAELNLKLKFEVNVANSIDILAEVSKKFKKMVKETSLAFDDLGGVFLDNPDQEVLPGILPVGIDQDLEPEGLEESKHKKSNKSKK